MSVRRQERSTASGGEYDVSSDGKGMWRERENPVHRAIGQISWQYRRGSQLQIIIVTPVMQFRNIIKPVRALDR